MAKIATFYDHVREIAKQEGCSVTEAMQEVKGLGVELLELSDKNILGREQEVERELSAAGLGVSAVPAFFNFGRDLDVDGQSGPVLEAAKYLGADKLMVVPGFFEEKHTVADELREAKNIIACIDYLAGKAAGYGMTLTMEDFDSVLSPCATTAGLWTFLDACPKLFCCFDTGNFRFMLEDELEAYDKLKGWIRHVHLKDRAYSGEGPVKTAVDGQELYPSPVGSGEIRIGEIVERLKRDGYDGAYVIEHYGAVDMLACLKQSVSFVKEKLAQ